VAGTKGLADVAHLRSVPSLGIIPVTLTAMMLMMVPVPVTVVTGGPEATLLAHHLVAGLAELVSVLTSRAVDSSDEDSRWLHIAPVEGSRASRCRSQLDLAEGLRRLVERRVRPDRIIVLLDGSDDLTVALQTILSDPDLKRLVELDGVIATSDAVAMSTRWRLGLPFGEPGEIERLAVADRIVIVRGNRLEDDALLEVMVAARSLAGFGVIVVPSVWPVHFEHLVGLRAWSCPPTVEPVAVPVPIVVGSGLERPRTVYCAIDAELDPDALDAWLAEIITEHGSRILRLQGVLSVAGRALRVCVRGVRSISANHSEQVHPALARPLHSVVVITGYGLDDATIIRGFLATTGR
jgi:hypothetical protein